MIGLVIASHGRFGAELLATARQIVGDLPAATACSVEPGTSPEELKTHLQKAIAEVDQGHGVLVFADLIGGSPCTQSMRLCQQAHLEVLTGVNLPMLLKASSLRATVGNLTDLAQQLTAYGQRSITCATDQLRARLAV